MTVAIWFLILSHSLLIRPIRQLICCFKYRYLLGVEKNFKSSPTKQDLAGRNSGKQIEIFKKITTLFNL